VTKLAGLLVLAATLLFSKTNAGWPVLAHVPPQARTKSSRLLNDANSPIAGKKLFLRYCTACHGRAAEGTRRAPSLSNDEMRHATPGDIYWILTNGMLRQGMPSWSQIPPPQRWQIASFLRSINSH
jgi:mono/diheme cytochrome c family protein